MIKLVVFDLDGVLVEARDIHYLALNKALAKMDESYVISREEHLSSYDGLPTSKKLIKLSKEKGLPVSFHKYVWEEKQKATENVISRNINPQNHIGIAMTLRRLKSEGYKIYCASNSIRSSVKLMLLKAGYLEYIDEYENVPVALLHGTSDLIVPYDEGFPFTINIALPVVYGSSRIGERLDQLGILNEVYIEEGEGHEYWGSLNGTWVSGPNEYYDFSQPKA